MTRQQLALLRAKTPDYRCAVKRAGQLIHEALEHSETWYIALSGGKDSTVVLDLVRAAAPDVPAVISIHKWRLPETTDYLKRIADLHYVASGSDHATGWALNWNSKEEAEREFPGIPWFERDADRQSFGRGEGGCFLGLRKDENSYRRMNLGSLGALHRSALHAKWLCSPIADWSTLDVWAYIHSCDLDYNRAYDVMERIGVPLERQRVGPLAVERALGYGQLAILKRGWPGLWNEYAAAHPKARAYA